MNTGLRRTQTHMSHGGDAVSEDLHLNSQTGWYLSLINSENCMRAAQVLHPRRFAVIHNGVDNRRFYPDQEARARIRQELGISTDEFCIGSVGNLLPVKDHRTLLQALDRVAGSCPTWRLLLLGVGLRARLIGSLRQCPSPVAEAGVLPGIKRSRRSDPQCDGCLCPAPSPARGFRTHC